MQGDSPLPLPDGTILVPYQAVQRMQNDAQLAALLADAVAAVIDKNLLRMEAATLETYKVKEIVADAAYVTLGLPAGIAATWTAEQRAILRSEIDQSVRVSLMLMHDAGYDIWQAPLAWWMLSSGNKPLSATEPPPASVELYRTIAAVWSQPSQTRILKAPAVDTATR